MWTVVLRRGDDPELHRRTRAHLAELGLAVTSQVRELASLRLIGIAVPPGVGTGPQGPAALLAAARELPDVTGVVPAEVRYPLASRALRPASTRIRVSRPGHASVTFGGSEVPVIAGPCSVESWDQLLETARSVREAGARLLRGGAYKPRTSPYSFQGLGAEGLELLARAREETGLLVVTEALDLRELDRVAEVADVVQVGTRNMSNFPLLSELGRCARPVLLKRGFSSSLEEWLLAAEYVLAAGNPDVILCERGVRTFGDHARFVLDLNIVPAAKTLSHLPVIVDPSHGTGRADCVEPLARAAVAVGADGVMLEVHPRPDEALSDGPQALLPERLPGLVRQLDQVAKALDRRVLGRSEADGESEEAGPARNPAPVPPGRPDDAERPDGRRPMISTRVGELEVHVLSAGRFRLDGGAMFGVVPKPLWSRALPADEDNRVQLGLNCLLVRSGDGRLVLVDTGLGRRWTAEERARLAIDDERGLDEDLAELGLGREDIDLVVDSHLHFDHAGGNVDFSEDGELVPAFPRATYLVQARERDDARAPHERNRGSYRAEDFAPLLETGRLETVDGSAEVAPGVCVERVPGHCPGMQVVRVESAGDVLLFTAESRADSGARPPRLDEMGFDLDVTATVEAKRRLLGTALEGGWRICLDHDPEVPLVRLERRERRGREEVVPVSAVEGDEESAP